MFLAGMMAFSGIAILLSSRATKTQEGNGLINAVSLPMTIVSGIFFSYQNFPEWAVKIIDVLPLTMLANGIRQVFIEGAMVADVYGYLIGLLVIGLVSFGIGLRVFRWY
jgi:ABC-type multidrug transport system permease subunit